MLLELESVSKTYPRLPRPILHELSLAVEEGETLAITGPSGSGKSTLLNIIGGLDRPSSGVVRLASRDLGALPERELAIVRNQSIGLMFQLHHLLPQCSVIENCLLPTLVAKDRDPGARERALSLLATVGLGDRINHRPGELSGGECQRVAVVRALINRPRLVLADEPTGALDRATAESLAELLIEINREHDVTLIVATHWLDLAHRLERVYELRNGRLEPAA